MTVDRPEIGNFKEWMLDQKNHFYVSSNTAFADILAQRMRYPSPRTLLTLLFYQKPTEELSQEVQDEIKKMKVIMEQGKNPGIEHSLITVPMIYVQQIFQKLLGLSICRQSLLTRFESNHKSSKSSYINERTLYRYAKGQQKNGIAGTHYFTAVKIIKTNTVETLDEIIGEPRLIALSGTPDYEAISDNELPYQEQVSLDFRNTSIYLHPLSYEELIQRVMNIRRDQFNKLFEEYGEVAGSSINDVDKKDELLIALYGLIKDQAKTGLSLSHLEFSLKTHYGHIETTDS